MDKKSNSELQIMSGQTEMVDVLLWKCPIKSGIIFANALLFLVSFHFLSVISLLAYWALAVLISALSYRAYCEALSLMTHKKQTNATADDATNSTSANSNNNSSSSDVEFVQPFAAYLEHDVFLPTGEIARVITDNSARITSWFQLARDVIFVRSYAITGRAAAILYVFTIIGDAINLLTLLIIGVIVLFTVPFVYNKHQTRIDVEITKKRSKFEVITSKASELWQTYSPLGGGKAANSTKKLE